MKIPIPRRRGDAWRIEFMFNGSRHSSTHDTEKEAKEWAARKILDLKDDSKRIEAGGLPNHTFLELLQVYAKDVSPTKKGKDIELIRINHFIKQNPRLVAMRLEKITAKDLIDWRNKRERTVSKSTTRRDMNLLSSILSYAVKELYWLSVNPMFAVSKPKSSIPRHRRISDDEINLILAECGYMWGDPLLTQRHHVAWCFLFAISTGMRRGEILDMMWKDVHAMYVHLPETKSNKPRDVPFINAAHDLLQLVRGLDSEKVIPISPDSLTFHDTRHEAATRMAQFLPIQDLAKVLGHTNTQMLMTTYYNPTAIEIAERMRLAQSNQAALCRPVV
jgi:integrase